MKARDVMTSPVVSIEPDASIWQAVRIMLQRHISGLPVIDQKGGLVGIVTEGDFLRRAETGTQRRGPRWLEYLIGPGRLADEYTRAHGRKVSEIMTADPLTITEDTPLCKRNMRGYSSRSSSCRSSFSPLSTHCGFGWRPSTRRTGIRANARPAGSLSQARSA